MTWPPTLHKLKANSKVIRIWATQLPIQYETTSASKRHQSQLVESFVCSTAICFSTQSDRVMSLLSFFLKQPYHLNQICSVRLVLGDRSLMGDLSDSRLAALTVTVG